MLSADKVAKQNTTTGILIHLLEVQAKKLGRCSS